MPLAKQEWTRTPQAYVFDTPGTESFGTVTLGAGVVNTTVTFAAGLLLLPCAVKVVKVGISFSATDNVTTNAVNIVYNTTAPPNPGGGAYLANGPAPNDNSQTAGIQVGTSALVTGAPNPASALTQIGGLGVPTNYAVNNQPLFAADIILNTTNFPGATIAGGGFGVFVPTNFDAVYPNGPVPNNAATAASLSTGYINQFGYFTLRAITTTSLTNLTVTLFYAPITMREKWGPPGPGITDYGCTPGVDF